MALRRVAALLAAAAGGWAPAAAADAGEFASQRYWDEHYSDGTYGAQYDWLASWNGTESEVGLRELLDRAGATDRSAALLHVGCGNSEAALHVVGALADVRALWSAGFLHVTHLDISPVVVEHLAGRLSFTSHKFVVGDLTALPFADGAFDIILDKGAVDAVFTGGKRQGRKAIREIARVLRSSAGRYVMVSMGAPSRRLPDLRFPFASLSRMPQEGEAPTFECETTEIKRVHTTSYGYICRRPAPPHAEEL